jgi:pectate lyase
MMTRALHLSAMCLAALMTVCACRAAAEEAVRSSPAPPTSQAQAAIPAFPGAEGFGAFTPGGRGGKVYVVTTLEDYEQDQPPIPGSFRAAVEAEGPRFVVFAVGGNIYLKRPVRISKPYITIAGQTAPGDGVCLAGRSVSIRNDCHDVVIRYLRVRLGDVAPGDSDAMGGRGCRYVILDHCSASWSIDECVSFYDNTNFTLQWCLVAESLYRSHHTKGEHGYGGIWGGDKASFHHNLLAHHTSRNPRFRSGLIDHRNNVIYNWGGNSAYGGENGMVNIVANYYKAGPATRESSRNRIVSPSPLGKWYVADNFVVGFPQITADNWKGGIQLHWNVPWGTLRVRDPFPAAAVTTQTAEEAYKLVIADVGANRPRRDSLDARIIEEVRTGTAKYGKSWRGGGNGIIDSQSDVGGWPELQGAPAPPDGDADGMPDAWEKARKLNPADAADASADRDGDGYINIEEYVNSLVAPAR